MRIERCLIKSFRDVKKLSNIMRNQIKHHGPFSVSFEFPEKQPEKPKKNLCQKIDERTPYLPFKEAKEGLRTLVHDIGTYSKKHPEGTVVRMLSPIQIILVIMFLISSITITFWLLTHMLPW